MPAKGSKKLRCKYGHLRNCSSNGSCRDCMKTWKSIYPGRCAGYTKTYRDKHKDIARHFHLKSHFGISLEDQERMLSDQCNRCAICEVEFDGLSKNTTPHIDHTVISGRIKVRGVLCHRCNAGLGHFLDNVESMAKAIAYLVRASK